MDMELIRKKYIEFMRHKQSQIEDDISTKSVDISKQEIVETGRKIASILEAVCLPHLDGKALEFIQLHWRCQDWFDHPDWDEYQKIVLKCKSIMNLY